MSCEADISTFGSAPTHTQHGPVAGPAAAICLGCLEIWEPNPCHNSSQGSRLPPSCTNGQSEARQQMTQKQGGPAATPKQCGHPAEKLMCIFILSQPCQHENKQYLFRVSSKHLLSQTNEIFFNCQRKQPKITKF